MRNYYSSNQNAQLVKRHAIKKSNARYFRRRGAPTLFFVCFGLAFMVQCAGIKEKETELSLKVSNSFQAAAVELGVRN